MISLFSGRYDHVHSLPTVLTHLLGSIPNSLANSSRRSALGKGFRRSSSPKTATSDCVCVFCRVRGNFIFVHMKRIVRMCANMKV